MARTTKEQRAQAVEMYNQGVKIQQISGFYGVSENTVRGWISPDFAAAQARKYAKRTVIRKRGGVAY